MKINITMKDPDGPYEAIQDAVRLELTKIPSLSSDEVESLMESRVIQVREKIRKWLKYGEYVTLEIDTEADTCVVLPAK